MKKCLRKDSINDVVEKDDDDCHVAEFRACWIFAHTGHVGSLHTLIGTIFGSITTWCKRRNIE